MAFTQYYRYCTWHSVTHRFVCSEESNTEALDPGWNILQHLQLLFWRRWGVTLALPVAVGCLWCHFHMLWGKKKFTAAPPMPISAIKPLHWLFGCKAIFCARRSLPLLALSLFNIVLPALVGNPPRVVPVSLHSGSQWDKGAQLCTDVRGTFLNLACMSKWDSQTIDVVTKH